ncbi:FUSC family protein [Streptomyces sp. NPDC007369]|uniref:FUSC family protein n=1 Tax=Streptomyces sp. NPDC007369 TaxID=3154589 RepID=UPI0033D79D9C
MDGAGGLDGAGAGWTGGFPSSSDARPACTSSTGFADRAGTVGSQTGDARTGRSDSAVTQVAAPQGEPAPHPRIRVRWPDGWRVPWRTVFREEGPAAARIVVTVMAAWQVALWLGSDPIPVFAALVPLIALRSDPGSALALSVQRLIGVVAGEVLGIAVLNLMGPSMAALAVAVSLGMLVGMLLRIGGGANTQIPISTLLLFANATSPDAYAVRRLWETAAGAGVTLLLAPLLWPPDPRHALADLARDSAERLARSLVSSAAAVGAGREEAAAILAAVLQDTDAVQANLGRARTAERAMAFNPLRRGRRPAVTDLVRRVALAAELAHPVRVLAKEAAGFAPREDLAAELAQVSRTLPALAAATARVIERTMAGEDARAEVAAAAEAAAADARVHKRPLAVALRRPVRQILDELSRGRPGPS